MWIQMVCFGIKGVNKNITSCSIAHLTLFRGAAPPAHFTNCNWLLADKVSTSGERAGGFLWSRSGSVLTKIICG